jgi:ABC-type dipeptide/oligopeptide/nickel transport system permease subunit
MVLRQGEGRAGCILLGSLRALAGVAPALFGDPNAIHPDEVLAAPSFTHWFGTDQLGRDQLARVAAGAPVAFLVAMSSVALAMATGTLLGVSAGYAQGLVDDVIAWLIDVLFSIPALVLALVVMGVAGPGLNNAIGAIAIVYVPRFARIARASTLSLRSQPFVEAARLSGIGPITIVRWHILPNIAAPLIVQTALSLSTAELAHAALAYLGLGLQPPDADWGTMLAKSRGVMISAPWLVFFPSLALVVLVVGFNLLADALRNAMNPRFARRLSTATRALQIASSQQV